MWYTHTHTHTHGGILLSHKKELNAICSNMDATRDSQTKWNKSERERQVPYDITYMWNLKYGRDEPIHKTETDSWTWRTLCFVLYETAKRSLKVAAPFCIPISSEKDLLSPHILTDIWLLVFWILASLVGVVSHCGFNLQLPNNILCGATFQMLIFHLYIFFGEVPDQIFGSFEKLGSFFWLLCVKSSLHVLDTGPLSVTCFADIFSGCGLSFHFHDQIYILSSGTVYGISSLISQWLHLDD